jgi:endonuclease VIII
VPEGDTIHRAAAEVRDVLQGRVPDTIATPTPRLAPQRWPARLQGRVVQAVEARGKHLLVRFEGALTLHSHLRMTGVWDVHRAGQRWRRARSRAWLVIGCDGWEAVQFDGPLLELVADARLRLVLAALGPDVLGEDFAADEFLRRLRGGDRTRAIGDALLDQRTVAGIGNVWKAESCFAARVDPWRTVAQVTDEQALEIVDFARERMAVAVRDGHSARPRAVYGRVGQPCPRCGAAIAQRAQGDNNRTTFWCPGCQS